MDKKVVRASYESCLDATARLASYATSKPFSGASEINERQDTLAADDLIAFCIHARRLVENVGLKELLNKTAMETSDRSLISLWKIIGCLIHHDLLMIFRCETRFKMLQASLTGATGEEFFKMVESEIKTPAYSEPIPPHVLFKSDRIHYTLINLVRFMQIFSQDILPAVIDKALDQGLCLLDDPLQDMTEEERVRALSRAKVLKS
ncbi:MAG: hypothetical protein JKY71_03590 [Alphaproteobacteria bacterium]|nr:hypothetical protein [Alphaproteobacteria bacterium]